MHKMRVMNFTVVLLLAITFLTSALAKDEIKTYLESRQSERERLKVEKDFDDCNMNWQPNLGEPCLSFGEVFDQTFGAQLGLPFRPTAVSHCQFYKDKGSVVHSFTERSAQQLGVLKLALVNTCARPARCGSLTKICRCRTNVTCPSHNRDLDKDCENEFKRAALYINFPNVVDAIELPKESTEARPEPPIEGQEEELTESPDRIPERARKSHGRVFSPQFQIMMILIILIIIQLY